MMSTDSPRRYKIDPDPAWDQTDEENGVLSVELSWVPDALAGRAPNLVASPELVAAMAADGLTGYATGAARGYYREDGGFGVEPGQAPPDLVRILVEETPAADFSYQEGQGLTVSERALALLRAHCENLTVQPVG